MVAWPCEGLQADSRQGGKWPFGTGRCHWRPVVPLVSLFQRPHPPQPTHIEETCLRGQPFIWNWPRRAANRRCALVSEVTEWAGGTTEALCGAFNQPRAAHNPPTGTVRCLVGWRALRYPFAQLRLLGTGGLALRQEGFGNGKTSVWWVVLHTV